MKLADRPPPDLQSRSSQRLPENWPELIPVVVVPPTYFVLEASIDLAVQGNLSGSSAGDSTSRPLQQRVFHFGYLPRLNKGLRTPRLGDPANLPFQEVRCLQQRHGSLAKKRALPR